MITKDELERLDALHDDMPDPMHHDNCWYGITDAVCHCGGLAIYASDLEDYIAALRAENERVTRERDAHELESRVRGNNVEYWMGRAEKAESAQGQYEEAACAERSRRQEAERELKATKEIGAELSRMEINQRNRALAAESALAALTQESAGLRESLRERVKWPGFEQLPDDVLRAGFEAYQGWSTLNSMDYLTWRTWVWPTWNAMRLAALSAPAVADEGKG